MKTLVKKNNFHSGSSTLEILIAFSVLILCLTSVIQIVFGNQSVTVDSETNQDAIAQAIKQLEDARANSRRDFLSVVSTSTTSTSTIAYTQKLSVTDLSPCQKQATSTITWTMGLRTQKVDLATFLISTATAYALGGDCDISSGNTPSGGAADWHKPSELTHLTRGGLGGVDTNDVDVENNILYIAAGASSAGKPDIILEDVTALPSGSLIDADMEDEGVSHYNAIDVARNNSNGKYYAYLYVGNDANTKQFHIINVTNINTLPTTPSATSSLPGVTSSGNSGGAIYFYNDKVYIGIGFTTGNEFHIYDVSSSTAPIWKGSFPTAHNVYKIVVRNQMVSGVMKTLAFVSLSTNNPAEPELVIYDVTNPAIITQIGSFNPPGNEYGTALYVLGNKAYLGRIRANPATDRNFYIVDISNPTNPTSCATCHYNIVNEDIKGIVVSNNFAFIITNNALRILDVTDQSNIKTPNVSPFGVYSGNFTSIALDSNKNLVYLTSPNQGSTAFYVIYSAP